MEKNTEKLIAYIRTSHIGASNAISGRQLCEYFGLTGSLVRKLINKLRIEGHPVCSNGNGYFYASKLEEIDATNSHLSGRRKEMLHAEKGLRQAKEKFIYQQKGGGQYEN